MSIDDSTPRLGGTRTGGLQPAKQRAVHAQKSSLRPKPTMLYVRLVYLFIYLFILEVLTYVGRIYILDECDRTGDVI